jgi:predicted phosphodiesterase
MKIQVYSDIHTEFYNGFPRLPPLSKYLFLAGDIGKLCNQNYKDFIAYCSKQWIKTFIVLGNHEFYHSKKTYNKLLEEYREFHSEFDNVILLEKDIVKLEDFSIIGLTFWSYIHNEKYNVVNCTKQIKRHASNKYINKKTVALGIDGHNELFIDSKTWLLDNYDPSEKTIILTHYPITQKNTLQDRLIHNNNKRELDVFSTDLNIKSETKLICISGHTHYSHDFIEGNVRYISNQIGYSVESEKNLSKFKQDGVYNI